MLGSLAGVVTGRLGERVLIEVNGVGYWVHTGSWQPSGEVTTYLHHHIREDADLLYGFPDLPMLALFERLIGVNGIGPKAALALLSLGSADRIRQAVEEEDVSFLSSAPGVGAKASQKIILELKGKLPQTGAASHTHQDVIAALESLGYKAGDIHPYLAEMPVGLETVDAQLRWTLQQIGK
jgi:holliday junction DNA helicase RuvA